MLSLTVHHMVFMTRAQRNALHLGETVEVQGVSVPVWFVNKTTSEPAREVFCKYRLVNAKIDAPIQILQDGYEITLPHRAGKKLEISDEEWRQIHKNTPNKLEAMYRQLTPEASSLNLLDVRDGGSGSLNYREHNKIKKDDQVLSVMHFVCLGSMEYLTENIKNSSG